MVSPINGYSQSTIPKIPSVDSGLQPSSAPSRAGPSGLSSSSVDVGLAKNANSALSGTGLSRPTIALLETMQAGRVTSALLSSLMGPNDSFFRAPSLSTITPQGQSATQRPNFALLESLQAGRANTALFSGMTGSAPGVRTFDSLFTTSSQGNGLFANPQSALTNAQDIIRAAGTGQPWIQNSRVAHMAYLVQLQAQKQVDQWSMASNPTREWFA